MMNDSSNFLCSHITREATYKHPASGSHGAYIHTPEELQDQSQQHWSVSTWKPCLHIIQSVSPNFPFSHAILITASRPRSLNFNSQIMRSAAGYTPGHILLPPFLGQVEDSCHKCPEWLEQFAVDPSSTSSVQVASDRDGLESYRTVSGLRT